MSGDGKHEKPPKDPKHGEIAKVDGDEAWIEPVIEYAREKNVDDPRMVTALCLCGRDGWLDGTFYKMLGDTDKPQDY